MISTHILASLDQEIITGLLKPLSWGLEHKLCAAVKVPKGAEKALDLYYPTLLLQASMRSEHPSSHRNSVGLLGWRDWISHLPPCLWLLSYFIQPKWLPEVQMMQAPWRLEFFPMEYSNLFVISTNIYRAFTLYLVPHQELVLFHSTIIYWVSTVSWELCSSAIPCRQGGLNLVKGLFIFSALILPPEGTRQK